MADDRDIVGRMLAKVKRKAKQERMAKEKAAVTKESNPRTPIKKGKNVIETLRNRKKYLESL